MNESHKDEPYKPDFTDPREALGDLSELFEEQLESYYARHNIDPANVEATEDRSGFTADFPGDRKLKVSVAIEGAADDNGKDPGPGLYVYQDAIFVNQRKDEWVASCMVHSQDEASDVTIEVSVEASHNTPKTAREKLRKALGDMGVTAPTAAA